MTVCERLLNFADAPVVGIFTNILLGTVQLEVASQARRSSNFHFISELQFTRTKVNQKSKECALGERRKNKKIRRCNKADIPGITNDLVVGSFAVFSHAFRRVWLYMRHITLVSEIGR